MEDRLGSAGAAGMGSAIDAAWRQVDSAPSHWCMAFIYFLCLCQLKCAQAQQATPGTKIRRISLILFLSWKGLVFFCHNRKYVYWVVFCVWSSSGSQIERGVHFISRHPATKPPKVWSLSHSLWRFYFARAYFSLSRSLSLSRSVPLFLFLFLFVSVSYLHWTISLSLKVYLFLSQHLHLIP